MYKANLAIVVPSCDFYSDIWEPLFQNFKAKWPDNPYNVYLVTNNKDFNHEGINVIKIGDDVSWSANLKRALNEIDEKHVFMLIDDLFFSETIKTEKIESIMEKFTAEDMEYLRMNPTPGPIKNTVVDGIGMIPKGDYYRSSTIMSIWKKDVLHELLSDEESAWAFEIEGSKRTDKYGNWYASSEELIPFDNLVIKGKYDPRVFYKLQSEGIILSDSRSFMSKKQYRRFQLHKLRSKVFSYIPRGYHRKLREWFIK